MTTRSALIVATLATWLVATPRAASADWVLTPYVGVTFGGDTTSEHVAYGLSAAWMSAGIFGVEVEATVAPDFLDNDNEVDFGFTDSNVTALMGNLIVGVPLGAPGLRPYASGGVGLLRTSATNLDDFFDNEENSFGVNLGAGIMTFVHENFGLRFDLRYFRGLRDADSNDGIDLDLGGLAFWRGTVGAAFRF